MRGRGKRRRWSDEEIARLRKLYPRMATRQVAAQLGRSKGSVNSAVQNLGLKKDPDFRAAQWRACGQLAAQHPNAIAARIKPGTTPPNKGLRRPGWAPGRMRETQFKPGQFPANKDPEFYVLGALRVNTEGYIDMRVSFDPGAKGWRLLHRILWEDAHGPVPAGHCLRFIDGDKLNVCLENLQLIRRGDNMRLNTIHNLPKPLVEVIQLAGAIKRHINRRTRDQTRHQ